MSDSKRDPADLLSVIYDKEFPLNNNTLSCVLGGAGSGKSYFCYNVLTPIYLDKFNIHHLLLCSKTAKCDMTLVGALKDVEEKYPHVEIQTIKIGDIVKACEKIRASAIKSELINYIISNIKSFHALEKYIDKEIDQKAKSMDQFPKIQQELELLMDDLTCLMDPWNYTVVFKENKNDPIEPEPDEIVEAKSALAEDPENVDINYVINNQGLALNRKPFEDDLSKPEIVVIQPKDTEADKALENTKEEIFKFIIKEVLKPRQKSLTFGAPCQPILIIVDDNVGERELSQPMSKLTQFSLLRRHLHANIIILSQSLIGLNVNLRRNTNSFHLLPTLSKKDLELLLVRLPTFIEFKTLYDNYNENSNKEDRNQQLTSLFCVHPYNKLVNGAPDCIQSYYP